MLNDALAEYNTKNKPYVYLHSCFQCVLNKLFYLIPFKTTPIKRYFKRNGHQQESHWFDKWCVEFDTNV